MPNTVSPAGARGDALCAGLAAAINPVGTAAASIALDGLPFSRTESCAAWRVSSPAGCAGVLV